MITPLLLLLQVAPAAPLAESMLPRQARAADPLAQLSSLRDQVSQTFELLQQARSSLRASPDGSRSMAQSADFQPLLDEVDEYVDYYVSYHQAQEAVVAAVEHAFFLDTPSCGATTEQVVLDMGGSFITGQTHLLSTLPAASGQATVTGSHGGIATAQSLGLLAMALPGNVQGGDPAFNHPVHYYSATLTDGSRHSGLAVQLVVGGQGQLVLYPDAVLGTSLFLPNDLALLRWALLESTSVLSGAVFDSVLVPFDPPGSDADDDGYCFRQDVGSTILCCQKAVQKWKKEMTDLAFYCQNWEKQIANGYEPLYEDLVNDIKEELGSHGVDVVMNDSFILDTGGMGIEAFSAKVDEFTSRKNEIDNNKKNDETNLKNARTNGTNNINNALRARLLVCLDGWPNAAAIADEIVAHAVDLVLPG